MTPMAAQAVNRDQCVARFSHSLLSRSQAFTVVPACSDRDQSVWVAARAPCADILLPAAERERVGQLLVASTCIIE